MDIRTRSSRSIDVATKVAGKAVRVLIAMTIIAIIAAIPLGVIVVYVHFIAKYW